MSSGADLFVVCKNCGSEVSPYITECPYCGHRVRQRAPKIPRETGRRGRRRGSAGLIARLRARPARRRETALLPERRRAPAWTRFGAESRPYATIALVAVSCGTWIAWRGGFVHLDQMVIAGPLRGDWWKLLTHQFAYENGWYAFVALVTVALFGWLLERRHGPVAVLALFFGGAVGGIAVTAIVYPFPVALGGTGGALALLCAWAVPQLLALRSGEEVESDLIGAAVIGVVVALMPIADPNVSWVSEGVGVAVGLTLGLPLALARPV